MSEIVTFKKYPDVVQASELKEFLLKNNIECYLADNEPSVDSFILGTPMTDYEVKIKQKDFERATVLVEERSAGMLNNIDPDYYLFTFTNEELYDILLKQDEWNEFDYLLAKKLLTERGKTVDEDMIISLKKQRIADIAKKDPNEKVWMVAGYIFSLLGGFIGIIIGYMLWKSKNSLPDGKSVYSYTEKGRNHGFTIFCIGIIVTAISLLFRFNLYMS